MASETSLIPSFVVDQGIVNTCLTRGADFEAYTGPMQAEQNTEDGRSLVNMIGSSTVKDLQGDVMALSALDDMTKIPDNLTILLNHDATVPDSIFGGLWGRPWIKSQNGIADLHLTAEVEPSNPKAMQTYSMIVRGRRLGCSIGCMVLDYDYDKDNEVLILKSVMPVEYSVVAVPANTRCWVEVAAKSLFERSLLEGNADKALQLAAAVRGMYRKSYNALVRLVDNTALRNDLERVKPRDTAQHRIMCAFSDKETNFVLANSKGLMKSLTRDETIHLLNTPIVQEEEVDLLKDVEPEGEHGWTVYQKAATGKTSWPLADLDTEWTGSKAEKDIFAWASNADGEIQPAKAKQGFLFADPDKADQKGGYKMPFCYAGESGLTIVPLGVRSCANVLNGGMGGVDASDEDKAGMRAKVKTMYGRINSQLKPDPEWTVPWEKGDGKKEDSVGAKVTQKQQKEIADSGNAGALNRQDLGEVPAGTGEKQSNDPATVKAADVSVSEDGTHDACTGTHTHQHKAMGDQGGDDKHSHSHTHQGDANHSHDHADKSGEETIDKQASVSGESDTTAEPATEPLASEPAQRTSEEKTTTDSPSEEDVAPTAQEEAQAEDASEPAVPTEILAVPGGSNDTEAILRALDEEAPVLEAKVTIWNDLAKSMGLPEYSWNAVKDYLTRSRSGEMVDANLLWNTAAATGLTQKEGRAISAKTKGVLQGIHDACMSLHPGVCSNASQDQQNNDDGDGDNDTEDNTNDTKSIQGEVVTNNLLLSVDQESVKQAVETVVTEHMKGLTSMIQNAFTGLMDQMVSNLGVLYEKQKGVETGILKAKGEMMALTDQTARLARMPMGRPTQITRSVEASGAATGYAATYQEMVNAGQQGGSAPHQQAKKLADLEGFTRLAEKQMPRRDGMAMTMQYRHWPAGVGTPVGSEEGVARPSLTPQQSIYMLPSEWEAYNNGEAASVPLIDDPFSV